MEGVEVNTVLPVGPNRRLYNAGSDWQKETGGPHSVFYSTQYREYDPALGRFHAIDPMASSFATWTPYMYGYNDPVNANDPNGAQAVDASGGKYDLTNPVPIEYQIFWHDPVGGTRVGKRNSTMPTSGNHWTDKTFTDEDYKAHRDYFLLSNKAFADKYDVDQSEVLYIDGKLYVLEWDPKGGEAITKEAWLLLGGDKDDLDENMAYGYSPGAWKVNGVEQANVGNSQNNCYDCGWNVFVGIEGEVSFRFQAKLVLTKLLSADLNLASLTLWEGKINNMEGGSSRTFKTNNYQVKQGLAAAYFGGIPIQHLFDVVDGNDTNHSYEFKAGIVFIGTVIKFDENGTPQSVFIGFDGDAGGAFIIGGNFNLKIGGIINLNNERITFKAYCMSRRGNLLSWIYIQDIRMEGYVLGCILWAIVNINRIYFFIKKRLYILFRFKQNVKVL
ncbi:MAG: RHS repeat-associated core domain-containing protein [Cyclobacteriaceae bacterium]